MTETIYFQGLAHNRCLVVDRCRGDEVCIVSEKPMVLWSLWPSIPLECAMLTEQSKPLHSSKPGSLASATFLPPDYPLAYSIHCWIERSERGSYSKQKPYRDGKEARSQMACPQLPA